MRGRDALRHRGPDEQGIWIAHNQRLGLAHTRLAIIDPPTGQQPVCNEDGSVRAIVNGEFYDFEQLGRELEARGHRLRTRSDSEILVHLYEERGAHAVRELNGEFAFVLWDEQRRLLLAGRDRFGIKPLVYAQVGDLLYIASEAKALFAAGVAARWDHDSLVQSCFVNTADRTLFENVRNVPPASMLYVTEGAVRIDRYWDLQFPLPGNVPITPDEAARGVRAALRHAVKRRLRADVPVGIYLSGGLDSCAIQAIAAEEGHALTSFTISFANDSHPEERRAREMAADVGARIEVVSLDEQMLADSFSAAARAAETMMINGHGVAKFLLSDFVRAAGFKVVLTGEGADEIFAGYPASRMDQLRDRDADPEAGLAALRAANAASLGVALPGSSYSPRLDTMRRLLGSAPAFLEAFAESGETLFQLFADRERYAGIDPFLTIAETVDVTKLATWDAVQRGLYLLRLTMLPSYMLTVLGDRMEMAHSIEGRVPYLDHELASYVASLPSSLLIRDGVEKQVLRDAVRDLLPRSIYERPKHPLRAPVTADGPMRQMIHELLTTERLEFLDHAKVRRLLEIEPASLAGNPGELNRHSVVLTKLASLCALQRTFGLS